MGFEQRYHDADAYMADTGTWHEEDAAWKAEHLLGALRGAGWTPGRVADVGCGTGGVLAHLAPRMPGAELHGFEIAEPAYRIAKARETERLRFHHRSLLDEAGEAFDLVLAMDVFEHVPDYLGFLGALRPHGAAFAFHIPLDLSVRTVWQRGMSAKRTRVGHLHFFTADTARDALRDTGYRVVAERFTHAIVQPAPAGLKAKLRTAHHRALFGMSPEMCARVLGGCSLMVLATPE